MNEQEFEKAFDPVADRFVTNLLRLLAEQEGDTREITVKRITKEE